MNWIWGVWAVLVAAALLLASVAERSMLRQRIDGANGFVLFNSIVLTLFGSLLVFALGWYARGFATAAWALLINGLAYAALLWGAFRWIGRAEQARRAAG